MNALQEALVKAGLVKAEKPTPKEPVIVPGVACPTGKAAFVSKKAAKNMQRTSNRRNQQQVAMRPYRCDFCMHIHLGHSRRQGQG